MTSSLVTESSLSQDVITEAAAEWIVLLTVDNQNEREQARVAFEEWKKVDPRHAAAASSIHGFIGKIDGIKSVGKPASAVLHTVLSAHRKKKSRPSVAVLTLLCALILPLWFALTIFPPATLMADMRANPGQWETHRLADGTELILNSGSAVNLHFSQHSRTLELVRGEIMVDVARDPDRPFLVETPQGSIRALGTRFVVHRDNDVTILSMIESKVAVQTRRQIIEKSANSTLVIAGQSVRIGNERIDDEQVIDPDSLANAWKHHQLVVNDKPLSDVLEEIGRHRRGYLHYDRESLKNIRVSAVLPMNDTGLALQLLQNNFSSLRVRMVTPYLVFVDTQTTR